MENFFAKKTLSQVLEISIVWLDWRKIKDLEVDFVSPIFNVVFSA